MVVLQHIFHADERCSKIRLWNFRIISNREKKFNLFWRLFLSLPTTDRGIHIALIYALVAERLSAFYEFNQWLTQAQGANLSADWLARKKLSLPFDTRKHLSVLSDQLARQIADSLSREAGLYTAHELMESLDPNYHSEISQSIMLECEQILDCNPLD